MEPEGLLLNSQEPDSGPRPDPYGSDPHLTPCSFKIRFNIVPHSAPRSPRDVLSPSDFPTENLHAQFSFAPCVAYSHSQFIQ
jgi:hypothetical protein